MSSHLFQIIHERLAEILPEQPEVFLGVDRVAQAEIGDLETAGQPDPGAPEIGAEGR